MHRINSAKRLIGTAALTCAAVLIPVAALAATAAPAAAGTPSCAASGLVVWLDTNGDGYAGGAGYTLNFTNLSGHACTLRGRPGVSAVNLGGRQLGRAAGWSSGTRHLVRLADGATATAELQIEDVYNFGNPKQPCHPVTAAGLRVYPPNQFESKVIPFPFSACSSRTGPVYMSAGVVQKS